MKKIKFLIGISFLMIMQLYAEKYKSIINDSVTWNIVKEGGDILYTDSIYLNGDTVINGIEYKKAYAYSYGFEHYFNYELYIREDSVKIFTYNSYLEREFISMDISLEKDDMFHLDFSDKKVAILVDSIYYENDRKIIEFDYEINNLYNKEKFKFIEGVGSNLGILYQGEGSSEYPFYNNYLLCAHSRDETIYMSDATDTCVYIESTFGINSKIINIEIEIFPNPWATSIPLNIKLNKYYSNLNYAIFDLYGRLIKKDLLKSDHQEIMLNNFGQGIYILTIRDDQNIIIKCEKLIIE